MAAVENTGPDRHFYVEYSKRSALEWTMKLGEKYKQRMGTPKFVEFTFMFQEGVDNKSHLAPMTHQMQYRDIILAITKEILYK